MANLNKTYTTDILRFKVPQSRIPMVTALVRQITNDISNLCPVKTGTLKASIKTYIIVK